MGLVVSDKKIFENCILINYFLTLWPDYATNYNGLNNFDRGPPRDHSCEVWSKFNNPDIEWSQKLTEHFVLRWAKNGMLRFSSEVSLDSSVASIFTTCLDISGFGQTLSHASGFLKNCRMLSYTHHCRCGSRPWWTGLASVRLVIHVALNWFKPPMKVIDRTNAVTRYF